MIDNPLSGCRSLGLLVGIYPQWHPTPALLPGISHGRRSLVGCSPWDREELDTTEQLHFHFSLSCIGEGNGNPLQCSCLENPRDGGAWWAAIYEVAQSWTRLTRLSSSSSFCSSFSCFPPEYSTNSPTQIPPALPLSPTLGAWTLTGCLWDQTRRFQDHRGTVELCSKQKKQVILEKSNRKG